MEEAQEHRGGPENMYLHMCMYVTATIESRHWFHASFEGVKSTGECVDARGGRCRDGRGRKTTAEAPCIVG